MPKPYENPLTPNKRLKELYQAMLELRILTPRKHQPLAALYAAPTLLLLDTPGDRLAAPVTPAHTHLLRKHPTTALPASPSPFFALGASLTLAHSSNIALIYLPPGTELKLLLQQALTLTLPVVFLTLPGTPGSAALASKLGVPGIPVESTDAIALYRVAQECFVRARAGGGPALIEPVPFPAAPDPIALLARQLIARRIVTQAWIDALEPKLRASLIPTPAKTVH